ncbi:MAG: homogentisate 1,2-dioxygenase [Myxococcota bacterium]
MSGRPAHLPRVEGRVSRQAHVDLPDGTYERELGREGFFGPATHMYHQHPPTSWSRIEGPMRPRAFDLARLGEMPEGAQRSAGGSPWDAPEILSNPHTRLRFWLCKTSMDHLVRNADGDDLLFVHGGHGEFFCDYGHLSITEGDYIVVPRGTMWRIECSDDLALLLIEATGGSYRLPDRGPLGDHAVFDPGVFDTPTLDEAFGAQRETAGDWQLRVRARGAISTITFPHNPLDAVGWKGTLSPLRINWRDIRPVTSARYHLPPSAHTTFLADRFAVCTFCPRPIETDPGALKVPFYHANDDFDEVIFYHQGDFFSRDNIAPGMLTFHPCGFSHGPHPGAREASRDNPRTETDEVAVMIDTRDALDVGSEAERVEWTGYVDSWREPAP